MVYTCITDTGYLVWYIKDAIYKSAVQVRIGASGYHKDIFTLQLISANGSVLISTATGHNNSLDYDERNDNCSNSDIHTADTSELMKTIRISKNALKLT